MQFVQVAVSAVTDLRCDPKKLNSGQHFKRTEHLLLNSGLVRYLCEFQSQESKHSWYAQLKKACICYLTGTCLLTLFAYI